MNETWRIVVVLLGVGLIVEAVLLVAVMRQVGTLLLHGGPVSANIPAGPALGTTVEVPGQEKNGHPALIVFTSSGCEQCKVIEPSLRWMHTAYGPGARYGHQLDLVAVLTDRDANGRGEHAGELGRFARTDLIALMQDWDVPGTPFAVALDAKHRVRGAAIVNSRMHLEMLAVEKLGVLLVPREEDVQDGVDALAIQQVGAGDSNAIEVVP